MTRAKQSWQPQAVLEYYFTPTRNSSGEWAKARWKNKNLPFLQYMYHGNPVTPLRCIISGTLGWTRVPCLVTGTDKLRFNIDFNHIRQEQRGNRVAGTSKDKGSRAPSAIFRSTDIQKTALALLEFMCIIPVSQEWHGYITQDSALGHITLFNYDHAHWPWFLQRRANYESIIAGSQIDFDYAWFVDHLMSIDHESIVTRYLTTLTPERILAAYS